MALSRRPARFERKNSMSKAINAEKLESLRAAAARVYINKGKPGDYSMEASKGAATAGIEFENAKEVDPDHGVKILAAAAIKFAEGRKNEDPINVGEKQC